mgnify:CR=1 FL=1
MHSVHNRRIADVTGRVQWWAAAAGQLLWPLACEACGRAIEPGGEGLCEACWQGLLSCTAGSYCRACGLDAGSFGMLEDGCARCRERRPVYDGIARAGVYASTLRDLVLAMKFHDRPELAARLAQWMEAALAAAPFAGRLDAFVPVPLHWRRRLARGFNQSFLLACRLARGRAPVNTDLVRVRHTPSQWTLSTTRRRGNVAGAFAVRRDHDFSGRTLCLVDDITTSGATLNECARVLKQAGAAAVYAVVAAVAMQDTD